MVDNWEVFKVVVALLTFVGTAYGMFYKPTHELKIEITKLNATLNSVRDSDRRQEQTLNRHNDILNDHETRITVIEETTFIKDRVN